MAPFLEIASPTLVSSIYAPDHTVVVTAGQRLVAQHMIASLGVIQAALGAGCMFSAAKPSARSSGMITVQPRP
jgi:hypothetical protein